MLRVPAIRVIAFRVEKKVGERGKQRSVEKRGETRSDLQVKRLLPPPLRLSLRAKQRKKHGKSVSVIREQPRFRSWFRRKREKIFYASINWNRCRRLPSSIFDTILVRTMRMIYCCFVLVRRLMKYGNCGVYS